MAIAYDNSVGTSGTAAQSPSVSLTISGTNRFIFACVVNDDITTTHDSATYNGVAMTKIDGGASAASTTSWWRTNSEPASGTHDFQINFSTTVNTYDIVVSSWTGVHQTTPIGTPAVTIDVLQSISVNVLSVAADEVVVDGFSKVSSDLLSYTEDASQTFRVRSKAEPSSRTAQISSKTGTGTVAMSWTWDASFQYVALLGVALKPAAEGPTESLMGAICM